MSNKWNSDLTPEQNYILKEEGTEPPGSSPVSYTHLTLPTNHPV